MNCRECSLWIDEEIFIDGKLYAGYCKGYPNLYYTEEDLEIDIGCDYFE